LILQTGQEITSGPVIVIFHHPPTSTLKVNIVPCHGTIEPVYNEPDAWNKCLMEGAHKIIKATQGVTVTFKAFFPWNLHHNN
jgi:hypothetical protein